MAVIPPGYEELSSDDLRKVLDKLKEKGAEFKSCELCGVNNWIVFPAVVSPNIMLRNTTEKTLKEWQDQSFDQVVFSCGNCGNSKFIELHFLGVKLSVPAKPVI